MDPFSIASIASGLLKYNQEVKDAHNAALRNSVYMRGGEWTDKALRNVAAAGYKQPDFMGNTWAGISGAMQIEQQGKDNSRMDKLAEALMASQGPSKAGGLDFTVPGFEEEYGAPSSSLFGGGRLGLYR